MLSFCLLTIGNNVTAVPITEIARSTTMKNTPANTAVRLVEFMDPRSDVALSSRRSHAVQDSEALRRAGRMVADLLGPYGIPPRSGPHRSRPPQGDQAGTAHCARAWFRRRKQRLPPQGTFCDDLGGSVAADALGESQGRCSPSRPPRRRSSRKGLRPG